MFGRRQRKKVSYAFVLESIGLSLFCSCISQRPMGIPAPGVFMMLCDHSVISCSDVLLQQSSQTKILSSNTSPDWWSFRSISVLQTPQTLITICHYLQITSLQDYNILNVFLYKTLLGKKKRRGGWDEVWKIILAEMPDRPGAGMSPVSHVELIL